jgi:hypothetical protein
MREAHTLGRAAVRRHGVGYDGTTTEKPDARDHGVREGALRLGLREHTGAGQRRKMAPRSIPAFLSLHSVAPLRSPSHVSVCSEFMAMGSIHVRGLVFILPRPIPNRHGWIPVAIPWRAHDGEENPRELLELPGRRNSAHAQVRMSLTGGPHLAATTRSSVEKVVQRVMRREGWHTGPPSQRERRGGKRGNWAARKGNLSGLRRGKRKKEVGWGRIRFSVFFSFLFFSCFVFFLF